MQVEVKICGITRARDARLAVELGAQFLGLNFWPGSARCLSLEDASPIVEAVRGEAMLVGVWVDAQPEEVSHAVGRLGLDLVQFHGAEAPDMLDAFAGRAIKAFRVGSKFDPSRLSAYESAWGFLFDCARPGHYGGTGTPWPYERIAGLKTTKPVIVAGGLAPDNVVEAVKSSGAGIVDVCSGVEQRPGIKDEALMRRFFQEVRHAQERD